jgi:hypothetical protein
MPDNLASRTRDARASPLRALGVLGRYSRGIADRVVSRVVQVLYVRVVSTEGVGGSSRNFGNGSVGGAVTAIFRKYSVKVIRLAVLPSQRLPLARKALPCRLWSIASL